MNIINEETEVTYTKGLKVRKSELVNLILCTDSETMQAAFDYKDKSFKWCANEYVDTENCDIANPEYSISIPSLYEEHIDDIALREEFASQQSEKIHSALSAALEKEHPYIEFSEVASRCKVDYAWMQYRDEVMEEWANQAAIEWCDENEIELLSDKADVKDDPNFIPILIG